MTQRPSSYSSILHYLYARGVTDDTHFDAGTTYLDWRDSYLASHGARVSMLYRLDGEDSGKDDKASKYLMLRKHLKPGQIALIEVATLMRTVHPKHQQGIYDARFKYLNAFNALSQRIAEVNEEHNKPLANHLTEA